MIYIDNQLASSLSILINLKYIVKSVVSNNFFLYVLQSVLITYRLLIDLFAKLINTTPLNFIYTYLFMTPFTLYDNHLSTIYVNISKRLDR